nr:hypothetical protein [Tanacetum cinerariifolium]
MATSDFSLSSKFYEKPSFRSMDNSKRMSYSEMLGMLVYKLECEIRGLFYCIPKNSLEIGLTLVQGDFDMKKCMEKEEARSPYLRTPLFKPRRNSIEFQGKNLYADFLHVDYVDDHFDAPDYWSYKDVYFSGCFDVGSFSTWCDWINERVGYDDRSLLDISKAEFSKEEDRVMFQGGSLIKYKGSGLLHVDSSLLEKNVGTESRKLDTSSSLGNYLTHVVNTDIRPVNNKMSFAEVHLTAQHNVLANKQQHTEQSEPIYDTYLLEKIDSNTPPDPTNICHREGVIVQDAEQYQVKSHLLNAELVKSKEMIEKEKNNELSHMFLLLEKHCISLELEIHQKDASFQSNKPGNNVDTKFVKASILEKPPLQPSRNHSVVRQPNAFKSERPRISKPRWKPTSRIFNTVSLRWVPTRKIFTDSTTKVDSEPLNCSNDDITKPYECDQTLNVSAGTLDLSAGLVQNLVSPPSYVPPSKKDYEILFQPLFDEYFNPPPRAVSPDPATVAAPRVIDPAGSPSSTTIDQDVPSASTSQTTQEIQSQVTHQGAKEQIHGHQNAQFDNAPLLHNLSSDPSSKETTLQGIIPSNLHHLNQSFDTLTKLTKNHPLENVISGPSQPVLT